MNYHFRLFSSHKRQNTASVQIRASEDKHMHTSALRNPGSDFFALYYGCQLCRKLGSFSFITCNCISSVLGQVINSFKMKYHRFREKVGGMLWVSMGLLAAW